MQGKGYISDRYSVEGGKRGVGEWRKKGERNEKGHSSARRKDSRVMEEMVDECQ